MGDTPVLTMWKLCLQLVMQQFGPMVLSRCSTPSMASQCRVRSHRTRQTLAASTFMKGKPVTPPAKLVDTILTARQCPVTHGPVLCTLQKKIDGSPTPEIGEAQGFTSVTIGSQTQGDIAGRAMVIHGPDGERIGCGIIGTPSELHAHVSSKIPFQKYPGYDGPYDVNTQGLPSTGDATIWSNGIVTLQYYINGVPVSCSKPSDKANSCGIHIHEGKRCDDASKVGGHYFDDKAMSSDPWANVVYTATEIPGSPTPEIGQAQGFTSVTIGSQTQADIVGRAMVIHGPDGERIGCGIISTDSGAIEV